MIDLFSTCFAGFEKAKRLKIVELTIQVDDPFTIMLRLRLIGDEGRGGGSTLHHACGVRAVAMCLNMGPVLEKAQGVLGLLWEEGSRRAAQTT